MKKRICPICGSQDKKVIKKINLNIPKEYTLANKYNIVSCNNCGFCFADTPSTEENFEYYYKNFNNYSDAKVNEQIIKKQDESIIKIIDKYYDKNSKILNIGIGDGHFEKYCFYKGYKNVTGLDPSKDSVIRLKKIGIRAINGSIYNENISEKFKAVVLIGTLEHLYDVKKAVQQLINFTEEDGIIIIAVPNIGDIHDNTTKIPNNFNHEHINYFSRISLLNLFRQYNFKEIYTCVMNCNYSSSQESEIISVFKKDNKIHKNLIKDNVTANAIKTYFEINVDNMNLSIINKVINSNEEVVIWGTGAYVMDLLANYDLNKCNILYYVDNNLMKQGRLFNGKMVKSPNKQTLEGKKILICSMLYANEIKEQIDKMKIDCKVEII